MPGREDPKGGARGVTGWFYFLGRWGEKKGISYQTEMYGHIRDSYICNEWAERYII